ncbi:hypothetical protein BDZ91DRAFT_714446 [Kalaharituber pfeilii]|nr:hypothetical protein BDZ91DRAFT_714446 [Kalaharituber pfeilii]
MPDKSAREVITVLLIFAPVLYAPRNPYPFRTARNSEFTSMQYPPNPTPTRSSLSFSCLPTILCQVHQRLISRFRPHIVISGSQMGQYRDGTKRDTITSLTSESISKRGL